jgi:hypothetical protein
VPLLEFGAKPHTVRARRVDGRDPLPIAHGRSR